MNEPKYLQIENELKKEITSGKFKYGDKFYSEKDLKEKFNVSSITVIRSVKDLVKAGYLVRYQGKGTFVSHSSNQRLVRAKELNIYPNSTNDEETMDVLNVATEHQDKIGEILNLPTHSDYYHITQLRKTNGVPFVFYNLYLPTNLIKKSDIQNLANFGNIYLYLQDSANLYLLDEPFKEEDSIVKASKKISQLLNIKEGELTVRQERKVVSAKSGEPLLYMINYRRCDYTTLSFTSPDYPEI